MNNILYLFNTAVTCGPFRKTKGDFKYARTQQTRAARFSFAASHQMVGFKKSKLTDVQAVSVSIASQELSV